MDDKNTDDICSCKCANCANTMKDRLDTLEQQLKLLHHVINKQNATLQKHENTISNFLNNSLRQKQRKIN